MCLRLWPTVTCSSLPTVSVRSWPMGNRFVMLHVLPAVVADQGGFVVVDVDVLVLLRMNVDFFLTGFVLEAQFVEALTLVGLAPDRHPRLVARQFVGRQRQRL